ncbi:hypothetical protein RhiirB3_447967 [Rhizophagus irregularis]|nr:hypothetical protein RhiirB3_447967 [Rhizophagus irregularis]
MKKTKIRSVDFRILKIGKEPRFVRWAFEFRRTMKNQDLSRVSQVGFRRTEYPKIRLAFGSWVLNIRISVHGFWIYGFNFRFLGFGYMGSALGWASEVQEIQRFVRHSGGLPKIGNPKNSFSFRVTSEDWKSKEFVIRHSGGLPKIGNPKNSFGTGVTSEEWKSKEFVRHWGDFRRMEKTKFHKFEAWFGGLPNSKDQKRTKIRSVDFRVLKNNEKSRFVSGVLGFVRFLDVRYIGLAFGSWVLNIWISVHGFWIYGFDFRFLGFGYIDFGFRFHFKLILNRSGFHFEFLVRFPLTNWGFPLQTLLDGRVFPSDFIRSGFLRTFIRLGEDDG